MTSQSGVNLELEYQFGKGISRPIYSGEISLKANRRKKDGRVNANKPKG